MGRLLSKIIPYHDWVFMADAAVSAAVRASTRVAQNSPRPSRCRAKDCRTKKSEGPHAGTACRRATNVGETPSSNRARSTQPDGSVAHAARGRIARRDRAVVCCAQYEEDQGRSATA